MKAVAEELTGFGAHVSPTGFFMFVFLSYSASFLWPRMGKESRFLLFCLRFCLWGEGRMVDLCDFFHLDFHMPVSIDSVCMSTCAPHAQSMSVYTHNGCTRPRGLDSQGLTSRFQLKTQEHSAKGTSASSLRPSWVDFPASRRKEV